MTRGRPYCGWVGDDPVAMAFHDEEWGRPPGDDRAWFELLCLEVFQAGLSWRLVLHRRRALGEALEGFDPARLARWGPGEIERALEAPGMIRNRRKVEAVVRNARAFVALVREHGRFDRWLDRVLEGGEAAAVRAFRERFSFLGPTLVRSLLESAGRIPLRHDPGCHAAREGAA